MADHVLLKELSPGSDFWTIMVRVLRKWNHYDKNNPDELFCVNLLLVDEEVRVYVYQLRDYGMTYVTVDFLSRHISHDQRSICIIIEPCFYIEFEQMVKDYETYKHTMIADKRMNEV